MCFQYIYIYIYIYIYYDIYNFLYHFELLLIITSSKRRSSSSKLFYKIDLLKNFTKFTGKYENVTEKVFNYLPEK